MEKAKLGIFGRLPIPATAKVTLAYLLAVIVWGAYVRATGSGAGCGSHWPLCQGAVIPPSLTLKAWIEFSHRLTSGLSLILVVILFFATRTQAAVGSRIRRLGGLSLIAIVLEALLGAGLVLLKYVEMDQSVGRAVSIGLHLINTLFLLAAVASLAYEPKNQGDFHFFPKPAMFRAALSVFVGVVVLGAIAALGDTLFPVTSFKEGLEQDLAPAAHFLIRLRVLHPVLALLWVGISFAWASKLENRLELRGIRTAFVLLLILQILMGFLNWVLQAPVPLQLLHLLVADLLFIVFWISGLTYES